MAFGLDYTNGPPISVLKSAGVTFVCRYLSEVNAATQVKLLTANEAKTLASAGIAIVSNYEWYGNRALESAASGVQDAQIAASQHAACGGTSDRPIYFSVDCDCAGEQTADYFRGVASVLGLSRTGAYGSYRVIKYLFDNHLIAWGWQTYAWSGGAWESRAHIRQYQNGVNLAGHSVDYDQSMQADYGQWMPGQTGGIQEPMLQLSDPIGQKFVNVPDAHGTRWHCTKTGQDLAYALLDFYRAYGGVFGLPITGEIYLQQYPNSAIQYMERSIICYDPQKQIDNPTGSGECYLLHIDSGLGQQAIAKPLLATLQAQADTLAKQVASLTDELAKAQAQPTPDTSALEAQITNLTAQLTAYKQAVASTEATLAALPK